MSLDSVVKIDITRETSAVSQAGFGVSLILGPNGLHTGTKEYESADAMLEDGYEATDLEYKMALAVFSQAVKPEKVKVGVLADAVSGVSTFDATIAAIRAIDDDWYGLLLTSVLAADVSAAAVWTESQHKLFATRTADANALSSANTANVVHTLNAAKYDRSIVIYHATAGEFPDAALLGRCLPTVPGSITWKFKALAGITADSLNATQKSAVLNKKGNTYTRLGGVNIFESGTVASGEFADVMHGIDWLHARMQERVYSRLVNSGKIPFTNQGIAVIESEIRAQLQDAVNAGLLASFEVTVPDAAAINPVDKANRVLKGVTFTGVLAGAVHKVEIQGSVTI